MSENPFQIILKTYDTIVHSVQTHVSNFIGNHERHGNLFSTSLKATSDSTPTQRKDQSLDFNSFAKSKTTKPLTKEELGRATWTLLHSIAAQYPDHPTRQQKRDAKELMAILCRLYPCKECAGHFTEVIRANPVQAGSQAEFSQWMCHIHNVVNRSLGKVTFPCERMDARWGKLECEDRACDLEGTSPS